MGDAERTGLLKDEYLQLQRAIDAFDVRLLTIKAWSVTFSLVTITAAFVSDVSAALLVGSFSASLFWLLEGYWKMFQQRHVVRIDEIEEYFAGVTNDIVPLQMSRSWRFTSEKDSRTRLKKIMLWPHVALPHAIVCVAGFVLYIGFCLRII